MPYNLIDERWIPVRCESGSRRYIAPWEISDESDRPLRIDSGRADFDGSLIQFLIGLMQTASPPKDRRAWRGMVDSPVTTQELRDRFSRFREAFNLDGDGPRFMQDLKLSVERSKSHAVGNLLIDSPGKFPHFVKRDRVQRLGCPATATALFALQISAPQGGRGHLTGLRGGSPLTTLLSGGTLYKETLLNVLPEVSFENLVPGTGSKGPADIFPWMTDTRRVVTPEAMPRLAHFWAMPRRIRIDFVGLIARCDLYGTEGPCANSYRDQIHGSNYENKGLFRHPLTPYNIQQDGSLGPESVGISSFQYRDWPKLTLGTSETVPAAIINERYQDSSRAKRANAMQCFGYHMVKAKPVAFRVSSAALLGGNLSTDERKDLATEAERRIAAAEHVLKTLRQQLAKAWRGPDAGTLELASIEQRFWSSTESAFFQSLSEAIPVLANESSTGQFREHWLSLLHSKALALFDEESGQSGEATDVTFRNIAIARRNLLRFTHPHGQKLRKECGLAAIDIPRTRKDRR